MAGLVWLVGSKGMLGTEVEALLQEKKIPHVATDLDCDITDPEAVLAYAGPKQIDWILNCSAYTAVDRAEDEPVLAFKVNADGPENLARLAKQKAARIIHISTDYVFDGKKDGAYTEEDKVNPIGVYGKSKAEGERRVRDACARHFIVRTSWLFGPNGKNFVYTMLRLFNEKPVVRVVNDQHGCPTYAPDLAAMLVKIVELDSQEYGTYHFTNEGKTTWYEFAREIYRQARDRGLVTSECRIEPITAAEYPTRAVRPRNSVLDTGKTRNTFLVSQPGWDVRIETCTRKNFRSRGAENASAREVL
ncbi:MAG TPA: dTDP-4-dehydrorhamnose reductase [Spirochaetia bacterium]|nr:dTDP-4-dehydrorhamnose reductase [Spirochaetia bacterium]